MRKVPKLAALIILIISFVTWVVYVATQSSVNKKSLQSTNQVQSKKQLETINGTAFPIDGDSLKINHHQEIRLVSIDAPEFSQKCLDKGGFEYPCGKISSDFLNKLIKGKNITCHTTEKDIYNRYLATCYLKQININQELIKSGMAIIDPLRNTSN